MHHLGMYDYVFIVMLICSFIIRAPWEFKNKKIRAVESREGATGKFYLLLVFTGSTTLPLLYLFTPWFDFANYPVSTLQGSAGAVLGVIGMLLFWKSHRDLGRQFSPVLEMKESHALVSSGIYSKIRHPMYTAVFANATAQLLLIGNWVVGPFFLCAFTMLYLSRINYEEKMMLDHFGSAYADYQTRTNRLFPTLRR